MLQGILSNSGPPFSDEEKPTLLRNIPLFADTPETLLVRAAKLCSRHTAGRYRTIVRAGDQCTRLGVIVEGRAKAFVRDSQGREVILAILDAGECFGEEVLFDGAVHNAEIVACERCRWLAIDRPSVMQMFSGSDGLRRRMMERLSSRLREANKRIQRLSLLDAQAHVARILADLAIDEDGVLIIRKGINGADVARMIGTSREWVSHIMKEFQVSGLLRKEGGATILAADRLETILRNKPAAQAQEPIEKSVAH